MFTLYFNSSIINEVTKKKSFIMLNNMSYRILLLTFFLLLNPFTTHTNNNNKKAFNPFLKNKQNNDEENGNKKEAKNTNTNDTKIDVPAPQEPIILNEHHKEILELIFYHILFERVMEKREFSEIYLKGMQSKNQTDLKKIHALVHRSIAQSVGEDPAAVESYISAAKELKTFFDAPVVDNVLKECIEEMFNNCSDLVPTSYTIDIIIKSVKKYIAHIVKEESCELWRDEWFKHAINMVILINSLPADKKTEIMKNNTLIKKLINTSLDYIHLMLIINGVSMNVFNSIKKLKLVKKIEIWDITKLIGVVILTGFFAYHINNNFLKGPLNNTTAENTAINNQSSSAKNIQNNTALKNTTNPKSIIKEIKKDDTANKKDDAVKKDDATNEKNNNNSIQNNNSIDGFTAFATSKDELEKKISRLNEYSESYKALYDNKSSANGSLDQKKYIMMANVVNFYHEYIHKKYAIETNNKPLSIRFFENKILKECEKNYDQKKDIAANTHNNIEILNLFFQRIQQYAYDEIFVKKPNAIIDYFYYSVLGSDEAMMEGNTINDFKKLNSSKYKNIVEIFFKNAHTNLKKKLLETADLAYLIKVLFKDNNDAINLFLLDTMFNANLRMAKERRLFYFYLITANSGNDFFQENKQSALNKNKINTLLEKCLHIKTTIINYKKATNDDEKNKLLKEAFTKDTMNRLIQASYYEKKGEKIKALGEENKGISNATYEHIITRIKDTVNTLDAENDKFKFSSQNNIIKDILDNIIASDSKIQDEINKL